MKAYVITILGHPLSEAAAERCIESGKKSDLDIQRFEAVIPPEVGDVMNDYGIEWNYPWEGEILDFKTGLKKRAYQTRDPLARIACALSHYKLWHMCQDIDEPFLILEHDAKFIREFDPTPILESKFNIVGINNPLGATRKAKLFHDIVVQSPKDLAHIPTIDNFDVPQGLAGNSAYIIKPAGATAVIEAVDEHGLWPNDAIMCRQLIKRMGVTRTFYTEVQGTPSTTTE
jgi:GR25 family glycosyltransferase involved in LPS biosynthesis